MRNNKKIIAFVCVFSMIFTLFAGLTVVKADVDPKAGIILNVEQAATEAGKTEATVTATYDSAFDTIGGAKVKFSIPEGATVTPTSEPFKSVEGCIVTPNDKVDGQYLYSIALTDPASTADRVLGVFKVSFPAGLTANETVELIDGAEIMNADGTVYLKIADGSMTASSGTLKKDPTAEEVEPMEKDTDYNKENVSIPEGSGEPDEVIATEICGIAFSEATKVKDNAYAFTATYTGVDTIGGAKVKFSIPEGATVTPTNEPFKSVEGCIVTPNDKVDGQYLYSIALTDPAATDGKILATFQVNYPEGGLSEPFYSQLIDGAEIMNADGTVYNKVSNKSLADVWVELPSSVVDDRNVVDLDDKISSELAEKADEGTADAYLAIEATDEDGKPATYGTDYEAYYNGQKINEDTLKALLAGEVEDVTLEDAVKGLSFKYNDGVKIKFQLVVGDEVADNGETEDDTPVTPGKDLSADGKIASKVSKSIKSNASKQTATFTVTPAKDKDGNVIVSDEPHVTITVKKSSYDAITGSGIEVAYTDYELDETDDDYEEAAVKTKTYYVYPSIQEADTEITLPNALDYKYEVSFTPAAKGTVEYTMTYYDANGKKAEATAKYTISEASTKSSSSGSSSDSKSSGGGAIATGLVDTGAGYLPSLGFDDLGDVEWAQTAINSLAAKKIVSGVGDNKFDPNAALTRAAYAQMLVNAIGHSQDSADVEFADVPTDSWFYHNVAVAAQLGIVSGYGDGNFGPYDLITREQMALMTQKAAVVMGNSLIGADNGTFTDDADIADWAHDAVYTLSNAGIINGMGDGTFAPKANATRAQAAVIIYNTFVK